MGKLQHQAKIWGAIFALSSGLLAGSAGAASVTVETEVYEWVAETQGQVLATSQAAPGLSILASFGPFHVVGHERVELVGSIETSTPAQFRAMLKAWPGIKQIDIVDCPGTGDDYANFAIARMIRKAGIATHVPDGGSARSGGVELFLAGARRTAAPTAEFAVHSWRDSNGYEADDYAANDPVNVSYVNFYREMGLGPVKAKAFYALTNSVPHDDALYLKRRDIAAFARLD